MDLYSSDMYTKGLKANKPMGPHGVYEREQQDTFPGLIHCVAAVWPSGEVIAKRFSTSQSGSFQKPKE